MADVDPEVTTAAQPTKRTFKKFSFRGVDLDALLDSLLMSLSSSSLHVLALASDLPLSYQIKHSNLDLIASGFIYTESYCVKLIAEEANPIHILHSSLSPSAKSEVERAVNESWLKSMKKDEIVREVLYETCRYALRPYTSNYPSQPHQ
ncbi:hypothetical protein LWI29_003992 [Acer saccharum]|uniref:Uncharacterized protein n=1 Tax=Acer saccharum TaxID=4024 RepID=A0AA39TBH8_ACESA|nr:hypothetical protein LWI29_003992 [Acer saccharum]